MCPSPASFTCWATFRLGGGFASPSLKSTVRPQTGQLCPALLTPGVPDDRGGWPAGPALGFLVAVHHPHPVTCHLSTPHFGKTPWCTQQALRSFCVLFSIVCSSSQVSRCKNGCHCPFCPIFRSNPRLFLQAGAAQRQGTRPG